MKIKLFCVIFLLLISINSVYAQKKGNIKILALAEGEINSTGAVADLYLELLDNGQERVILDTFPLSKLTTQISMRFAQQIACKEFDVDCSNYDFFYTIKSIQGIVGGPSAGVAATILTTSLLKDLELDESVAITGTINSGGLIGPVGGIKQKIEAASKLGFKKVLIPKGTREQKQSINNTEATIIDLVEYGKGLNVEVIEVSTISEALSYFNSKYKPIEKNDSIIVDDRYNLVMKNISEDICNRSNELIKQFNNTLELQQVINLTSKAQELAKQEKYYSSSSFCFRSNIFIKNKLIDKKNLTLQELKEDLNNLANEINGFDQEIDQKKIETISDLQTFMAVSERIIEAKESWIKASESLNDLKKSAILIGYAQERIFSARTWSKFFNGKDKSFLVDNEELKRSCESKISEAEERYNYVLNYLPDYVKETRKDINLAYSFLKNESYVKCLYKATKAKSESDVILSLLGVDEKRVPELLNIKLSAVKNSITRAQKNNIFPIISYSYYEYSDSLKDFDVGNALLFAEYALEFSNLDIYFEKKNQNDSFFYNQKTYFRYILLFIGGLIIGVILGLLIKSKKSHNEWHSNISGSKFKTLQTSRERRLRGKKR